MKEKMIVLNSVPAKEINFLPVSEPDKLSQARRAAEAHRIVRAKLQNEIKIGTKTEEIFRTATESIRTLLKGEVNDGIGFPTGINFNDVAAHDSYDLKESRSIEFSDVIKIDIGVHVNGWIMDSAFTVCFDPFYEPLVMASKEGTARGIKLISPDVRVCDIGAEIAEVISSYELSDGTPIRPVSNLNGHSIDQFEIHSGLTIPCIRNDDISRIKADCFYAIETFATTGKGYVTNGKGCTHYSLNKGVLKTIHNQKSKKVLNCILKSIKTLPFHPHYVDCLTGLENTKVNIDLLTGMGILQSYPPLIDSKGSRVAQFEHTVYVGDGFKEIMTLGEDY